MKYALYLCFLLLSSQVFSQTAQDKDDVTKACMGYIDGFYKGDTLKLKAVLSPKLHKFGFWKDAATGSYGKASYMSYQEALQYAQNVFEKKNFAKADAPKKVEILDLMDHIAAVKVTAWWGYDYILLSKQTGDWIIEEVLWQGPYKE